MQLLRESSGLRSWLATAFLEPRTRARLAHHLAGKARPPRHAARGRHLLVWFSHSGHALETDIARLARARAPAPAAPYGGLTRGQLAGLIRRHQSGGGGNVALAAFLFARAWRAIPADAPPNALLLLLGGMALQAVFAGGAPPTPLIRHLAKAAEFFDGHPRGSITRAHYGHANWWKLSVLHYMLNHPRPRCRTRDSIKYLDAQKITVDAKDLRRFCKKHRIARDTRPRRPTIHAITDRRLCSKV